MTPQDQGREFEIELADELGLSQTPASGSVWHSKLDLTGLNTRWSLKFTSRKVCPLSYSDFEEALEACFGHGGDGAVPFWAMRIEPLNEDFIVMRKEDFKLMQRGDVSYGFTDERPQVAERKARARQPELLRED